MREQQRHGARCPRTKNGTWRVTLKTGEAQLANPIRAIGTEHLTNRNYGLGGGMPIVWALPQVNDNLVNIHIDRIHARLLTCDYQQDTAGVRLAAPSGRGSQ